MEGKVTPHAFDGLSDTGVQTNGMCAPNTLFRVVEICIKFIQKPVGVSNLRLILHAAICVCVSLQLACRKKRRRTRVMCHRA